jgi:hypothetical protein
MSSRGKYYEPASQGDAFSLHAIAAATEVMGHRRATSCQQAQVSRLIHGTAVALRDGRPVGWLFNG